MGPIVTIAGAADDRVRDYLNLNDAELRRTKEPLAGLFIAEGTLVIRQLLASKYPIRSFLLTRPRLDEIMAELEAAGSAVPVYLVGIEAMQEICGFRFHRGALASAQRLPPPGLVELLRLPAKRVVVAEGISDHENLGALFRNAAAFGLDAVLLSPNCADPLYRRSVRVSMGQVLRVPWARIGPWPDAIDQLKSAGFAVLALTPDPSAPSLDHVLRQWTGSVALLVGAEGPGLSVPARRASDAEVRIPMAPGVDSLNVATAAAIAFHRLAGG